MKWITVKEMSEKYGISHQCIYKKIDCNRHKLGDHIREEYRKPKLLDEVAVEQLRPKNKEVTHRKNDMEINAVLSIISQKPLSCAMSGNVSNKHLNEISSLLYVTY